MNSVAKKVAGALRWLLVPERLEEAEEPIPAARGEPSAFRRVFSPEPLPEDRPVPPEPRGPGIGRVFRREKLPLDPPERPAGRSLIRWILSSETLPLDPPAEAGRRMSPLRRLFAREPLEGPRD